MKYLICLVIAAAVLYAYMSSSPLDWLAQVSATPAPAPLPSARLGTFLSAHLDGMLVPLGADKKVAVDKPQVEIAQMQASFADGMAKAPAARKPAYQTAIAICQELARAIDERERAAASYLTAKPLYVTRMGKNYLDSKVEERWDKRAVEIRQSVLGLYARQRELEAQGAPKAPRR